MQMEEKMIKTNEEIKKIEDFVKANEINLLVSDNTISDLIKKTKEQEREDFRLFLIGIEDSINRGDWTIENIREMIKQKIKELEK